MIILTVCYLRISDITHSTTIQISITTRAINCTCELLNFESLHPETCDTLKSLSKSAVYNMVYAKLNHMIHLYSYIMQQAYLQF